MRGPPVACLDSSGTWSTELSNFRHLAVVLVGRGLGAQLEGVGGSGKHVQKTQWLLSAVLARDIVA